MKKPNTKNRSIGHLATRLVLLVAPAFYLLLVKRTVTPDEALLHADHRQIPVLEQVHQPSSGAENLQASVQKAGLVSAPGSSIKNVQQ